MRGLAVAAYRASQPTDSSTVSVSSNRIRCKNFAAAIPAVTGDFSQRSSSGGQVARANTEDEPARGAKKAAGPSLQAMQRARTARGANMLFQGATPLIPRNRITFIEESSLPSCTQSPWPEIFCCSIGPKFNGDPVWARKLIVKN
jgi:hypothetical protein